MIILRQDKTLSSKFRGFTALVNCFLTVLLSQLLIVSITVAACWTSSFVFNGN